MPRVTIEFNLPDEMQEYLWSVRAVQAFDLLEVINNEIRSRLKHGFSPDDTWEAWAERIRRDVLETIDRAEV